MDYDWEQCKIRSTPILPSNHHPFISVGKYPRTGKKIRSNFTEERAGEAGKRGNPASFCHFCQSICLKKHLSWNQLQFWIGPEHVQLKIHLKVHFHKGRKSLFLSLTLIELNMQHIQSLHRQNALKNLQLHVFHLMVVILHSCLCVRPGRNTQMNHSF